MVPRHRGLGSPGLATRSNGCGRALEATLDPTQPSPSLPCPLSKLSLSRLPLRSTQEFDTACALTRSLLQRLLGSDVDLKAKRIDDGGVEGEPCAGGTPAAAAPVRV